MADETAPSATTTQISTTDLTAPAAVPTTPDTPATGASPSQPERLYPPQGPAPDGTQPGAVAEMEQQAEQTDQGPAEGTGIEGEEVVWEARYAMKNFLGRIFVRSLLTLAWIAMAVFTWGYDEGPVPQAVTIVAGVALLIYWLALISRIILARFGHHYQLTTRRLFVSTGLMRRRRDQLEILRVKDVFTRQSLVERWLKVGTVIVVPDDRDLPTFYLAGVDDPQRVHDLVWHVARAERDGKSVRVQEI